MKTPLLIIAILAITLFSFTTIEYDLKNSTAEVNQYEGLYVFVDAKPAKEYDYLGTEKVSVSWSNKYTELRNDLLKKSKKDFPEAQALIIDMTTAHCDVIKFK